MATVQEVIRRLKQVPQDRKMVVVVDGEFYDIDVDRIQTYMVHPSQDWSGEDCYQVSVDPDNPSRIEVLAIA